MHSAWLGQFECFFKVGAQLREKGNPALSTVLVVFRLRRAGKEALALPIHIWPSQLQVFRRTAQTPVAGQSHDQPPFGIGAGVNDPLGVFGGNEVLPVLVGVRASLDAVEGVAGEDVSSASGLEELPSAFDGPAHSGRSVVYF